jgi:hypothetical protein
VASSGGRGAWPMPLLLPGRHGGGSVVDSYVAWSLVRLDGSCAVCTHLGPDWIR